jgi:hypothetical protein
MGKMLDIPECEDADMYPEFPRGHHASKSARGIAPNAFYDEPGFAGAGKVPW